MTKIVINNEHGGFSLSEFFVEKYFERKGWNLIKEHDEVFQDLIYYYKDEISEDNFFEYPERDDPLMVSLIEEFGDLCSNKYSKLQIVEIPDDVQWQIEEYDGWEWVAEKHRTWG